MPNNAAWDTATTDPANRATQAVSLNVAARAAVVAGPNWPAEFDGVPVVFSGFELANKTPEVNDVGFAWSDTSIASVVTMDPDPLIVYDQTGVTAERPADLTKNWTARTGNYALRLFVGAGTNWPEQSWNTTSTGIKTLWMGVDMRVPVNFDHKPRIRDDGTVSVGNNQKLFRLFMESYQGHQTSGGGSKVGMEFRRVTKTEAEGPGHSYWYVKNFNEFSNGGDQGNKRFITIPQDQGKWMRICFRVQCSSTPGVADGSIEVWRKWEDEVVFTKEFDFPSQQIPIRTLAGTVNAFKQGDLFGYQNAPYAVDTEFLWDNFELAEVI